MNDKGKKILLVIVLLIIALVGGTYAFWTWTSPENKNVVFNTSNGLKEFIVYDEGDSKFVGDFQVADSYTGGVHTTVSISKTASASNVDFYATIYMDINEIGTNLRSAPGLKWTVTKGDSTSTTVVSSGDFVGNSAGDTLTLYNDIEVTTATQKFTIWLWIDSSLNPSDELSGETIDSSVWTQVNQVVEDKFEITKLTIFRDKIYATAVNSTANIMYYAVTSSNTTPTSWTAISTTDQNRIYSLEYTTTSSGTNYVWFKDKNNKVISKAVTAQLNYNINYYDVGGGEFSGVHTTGYPTTYKYGTAVTFDTPTKTGYTFLGYFTNKNGSGTAVTGITSTQTGDVTLFAKWEATTYTISYNGNMFSTNGLTTNGLTFSYDYENSILTINGTATGDTYIISFTNNLTFVEGDKYNVNFSYVSGSLTTNNGAIILFSTEVVDNSKNSLSPRNHIDTQFPTSSTPNNGTLSISSLAATSGSKLRYWVWSSDTSGNITFNNYKVKVNITKVQTKTIAFNGNYGTLPVPKREGFTFDGWYTGNNGTGTRITSDSIFTGNADQTLYAKWIDDIEPYGYADLRLNNGTYTLSINNYGDGGSGVVTPYGFALIDSGRCEEATYVNQGGTTKTYNSGLSQGVAYYGCIKLSDRAGNKAYLRSAAIPYANSSDASKELTYNNNGGTGCYYSSVIPGAAYGELCIPIKDGYSFTGWYTAASNGTKITSSTIVTNTNNHTVYAHWTADTKPSINFGTNGTDGVYIKGDANSKIVVNKGSVDLNTSSFKYIWSSNTTATPDTPFTNKAIVNFKNNNSTGTYYLIAKACDMNGTCTSLTSAPFYIDNTSPSGSVALSFDVNTNVLTASLTASDSGSGISNYGYLIQNSSSCPTSGYIASSNNGYNFNITTSGTYYVCVKLMDKVGNISYVSKSTTISMGTSGSDIIDDRDNIANLSNNLVGDMYRYQGTATAVTNNYICFGTSDMSACTANQGTYMYRIIGIDTSGRMKLIKKEALDTSLRWSPTTNEWAYATTFTSLNDSTFLTNTTFVPSGWSDKIATITWKYGKQSSALNQPGTVIYDYEIGSNAKFTSTVDAKISLMYMHDYYLALNNTTSCGYGGSTYSQCKNGWISLSTNDSGAPVPSEWTMSASANNNSGVPSAWMIYSTGYTTNYKVTDYLSIRPVFFLNSSVNIVDGTGTISDPYMIG